MKKFPYGRQSINDADIKAVEKVLRSEWLTTGPRVKEFEKALCKYTGAKYAVAVSSGTAALHVACIAAGLKKGDEAITSPMTFAASSNCVLYCGAKPVFADIDPAVGNIDPAQMEKKISKKTKLLIPVHYAGHPCDMTKIQQIAKKKKLCVIEDAAHAIGASYKDSEIGACKYSDMTTLSFFPVKHITMGEGGAVLTNRKDLYKKLILARAHGIAREGFINQPDGDWYYEMQTLGYNYRITDIQCALGLTQLKRLDRFVKRRRKIVQQYNKLFCDNPYFDLPTEEKEVESSFHLFPIRLKKKYWKVKKQIFAQLRKAGVGVQVHYIPVYFHPYYQDLGYKKGLCKNAEEFYFSEMSIPLYPLMTNADVKTVAKRIFAVFEKI